MEEMAPFFSGIVAAVIAAAGTYAAVSAKLASLEVAVQNLRRDVEKHNNVVERTALLERESKAAWRRIEELRTDMRDMRVEHAHNIERLQEDRDERRMA